MSKSADAFRTISEVAEWLDTPAHVLRFWESKFSQVKPVKRAGGRRYYRPQDMMLLGGIKKLLHDDGMTIKHVQKLLRQEGVKHVAAFSTNPSDGSRYVPIAQDPAPEPEPEVTSVVSFRTEPDLSEAQASEAAPELVEPPIATPDQPPETGQDTAPDTQPEPEPRDVAASPSEGERTFPSFLSGDRGMPQPEGDAEPDPAPAADADAPPDPIEVSPSTDTPASTTPQAADIPAEPVPHLDIFSHLAGMSADDIRAHEATLRPVMDRIRAQLERLS